MEVTELEASEQGKALMEKQRLGSLRNSDSNLLWVRLSA
jgi:hypothetical protein